MLGSIQKGHVRHYKFGKVKHGPQLGIRSDGPSLGTMFSLPSVSTPFPHLAHGGRSGPQIPTSTRLPREREERLLKPLLFSYSPGEREREREGGQKRFISVKTAKGGNAYVVLEKTKNFFFWSTLQVSSHFLLRFYTTVVLQTVVQKKIKCSSF